MAFLGVQLIITMVMLSFLHKLSTHFSVARWLLSHGLVRFLHPSDEQLRSYAGMKREAQSKGQQSNGKEKGEREGSGHKQSKRRKNAHSKKEKEEKTDTFSLPRNMEVTLEADRVKAIDLYQLQYYPEYQWLIDFGFCALLVYICTEVYYCFFPSNPEFNLSLVWCILVIAFSMKMLLTLTTLYFRGGDEGIGERSICIVSACLFFLIAMVVLIVNENFLEFGLNSAYSSFNQSAYSYLESHGMGSVATGPTSKLMFKLWLAFWCGLISAMFTFPGLRLAQMHKDSLIYAKDSRVMQLILNMSFVSPLIIVLLWIKPMARTYFTEYNWPGRGVLLSTETFETSRLLVIVSIAALRMALMPRYLQAYLNLAPLKLTRMKKEAGKISNVDLQRTVARVFYYLCVVTLQYMGPLLMCLYTALLMKVMGEYTWTGTLTGGPSLSPAVNTSTPTPQDDYSINTLRTIFNPILFRGVLGFMTWWMCSVWFTTSVVGFVYHSYFS